MNVISILTAPDAYLDRVLSINELGKLVGRNIVICKQATAEVIERFPLVDFIHPEEKVSGVRFFFWAARRANSLVTESPREDWKIVEVAVGFTLLLLRFRYRVQAELTLLLVSPSITMLVNRAWRRDRYSARVSFLQSLSYLRQYLSLAIQELVYVFFADAVLTNSQTNLDEMKFIVSNKPRAVLPNCVATVRNDKTRYQAQKEEWRFLVVSALEPYKGIGCLLEILKRLEAMGIKFSCDVAGRIPWGSESWLEQTKGMYAEIAEEINWLGNISRDELDQLYRSSDILLLPSFYEGSPRVVYEASSHGCLVVTSRLSGTVLIDPEEEFLMLFEPGGIDEAVSKIVALMNSNLNERSEKAQQRMERHFSPARRAERLHDFLVATKR